MASKLQIITAMFNDEVGKVTSNLDNWTSFLRTASNNFKYNFVEQILIYSQRPDATACAVKTTSGDNPLEVVTLDDTKTDLLRINKVI